MGKSAGKKSTQTTVSEVAKRYNKIKGENGWGCFLMGQDFQIHSRIKEHVTNDKFKTASRTSQTLD